MTVTGYIRLTEAPPQPESGPKQTFQTGERTATSLQLEWYRVDIDAIQAHLPYEVHPIYLQQSSSDGERVNLPYRIEPQIDLSDGPHLGYATQWYLFALILGVGYIRLVTRQVTPDREVNEFTLVNQHHIDADHQQYQG